MIPLLSRLASAGVGAALMYYFDPERGPQRRAMLREQSTSAGRQLRETAQAGKTDARNRAYGVRALLRSRGTDEPVDDNVLTERVRAAVGHCVSHPGAIHVAVNNGRVTLTGPILTQEAPLLIDQVLGVAGVRDLDNRLQRHAEPGNVPELQGTPQYLRRTSFIRSPRDWTPSARLGAALVGGIASLYGLAGRGIASKAFGLGGLALLTRATTNLGFGQLSGLGKRHAIKVQKSIRINAPIEHVFSIWANSANFPQFMTHVRDVQPIGDRERAPRRWHWRVRGSSGMEFEFDTQITDYQENRQLAWRSEPGAFVQHAGQVRFVSNDDRSTTAHVTLSYTPPAGAIGHIIAKLLGDDPKSQMDDDLMRMKTFIETGVQPRDAARQQQGNTVSGRPGSPPLSS
jgi:uncharacterized membrane protein